jgi:hypothetical protein
MWAYMDLMTYVYYFEISKLIFKHFNCIQVFRKKYCFHSKHINTYTLATIIILPNFQISISFSFEFKSAKCVIHPISIFCIRF